MSEALDARINYALDQARHLGGDARSLLRVARLLDGAATALGLELQETFGGSSHRQRLEHDALHHLQIAKDLVAACVALATAEQGARKHGLALDLSLLLAPARERAGELVALARFHWEARLAEVEMRDTRAGRELAAALAPEGES